MSYRLLLVTEVIMEAVGPALPILMSIKYDFHLCCDYINYFKIYQKKFILDI